MVVFTFPLPFHPLALSFLLSLSSLFLANAAFYPRHNKTHGLVNSPL